MRDIPDYTLMMPDWVWRYYEQSGDKALLASSYETLKSVAAYVKTNIATSGNAAGLVYNLFGGTSSYQYGIIDWPAPMRYGYTFNNNAARTIHNAHAVGTLRATAKAARELGKPEDGAVFDAWADDLSTAINAKLTRSDGLYTDGLSSAAGNPQIENAAQHAQTYPVYYGVAPAANRAALAANIKAQGMKQGPMTWHVLLKALTDLGDYDQVVKLMTDENADGPARTLAQQGTFMWEQWNPGCNNGWPCAPTNNESMSHGWGAWGIVDQIESLAGIAVTSPGAATVRIEPPAVDKADLHRVDASAWTQRGTVGVAWKRVSGTYVLDVDVPTNVTATVAIPNPGGAVNYVGVGAGAPKKVGQQGDRTVFTVGSGSTHFSIGAEVPGGVGGTVPPTLSLQLGTPASFGAFTPGVAREYTASTTANVVSTAGDATLSVADPSTSAGPARQRRLRARRSRCRPRQGRCLRRAQRGAAHAESYAAPVSNDAVPIDFRQSIGANDPLRTGTYSKTLTFTLSTTNP